MAEEGIKFVNSLFCKNLIENCFSENGVKVKSHSVQPLLQANPDSPLRSLLNRIAVRYTSQEHGGETNISVVIKSQPLTGVLGEALKKCDLFDKEMCVYKTVLPAVCDTLKKCGAPIELGPFLVNSGTEPTNFMILEDLTERGYCTVAAKTFLNFEQCKMALEKLAFFHAASVVIYAQAKDDFAKFAKGIFTEENRPELMHFPETLKKLANSGTAIGLDEKIIEKLKKLAVCAVDRSIHDTTVKDENDFVVLNHGDFWTNNIMFRYENGILEDAMFIDYQNCVLGSPIIDLMYFLTSSAAPHVLATNRDELIYIYHTTLVLMLDKLGYNQNNNTTATTTPTPTPTPTVAVTAAPTNAAVPTLKQLHIELLEKGALEVILTLTVAPFMRASVSVDALMPTLSRHATLSTSATLSPTDLWPKTEINGQLQRFDNLGLLDWGSCAGKVQTLMACFQRTAVQSN